VQIEQSNNACKDCKFYVFHDWNRYSKPECLHPKVKLSYFDKVYVKLYPCVSCKDARRSCGKCVDAKYFEEKQSLINRITSYLKTKRL